MSTPRNDEKLGADRGIPCPKCGGTYHLVSVTYNLPSGKIRRRRQCRHCQRVFYTIEMPSSQAPRD